MVSDHVHGLAASPAGICSRGVVSVRTDEFVHDGHRLAYDDYGKGPRPLVLLPGLLLPRLMHRPLAQALAKRIPRGASHLTDVGLEWVSQDPGPSAAVLQGLFFGRTAPPRTERSRIEARSLVIGHPRDPLHPFSDSDMLVRELRNGRLLEANSILELRLAPARLTGEIARFLDECWRRPARAASDEARQASA